MESHRFESVAEVLAFVLAGNATFTLRSKKTGTRFTYRIRKPTIQSPHFVSMLTGSDNENSYQFLGTLFPLRVSGHSYAPGRKSRIPFDAPGARAFDWFWRAMSREVLPDQLEIWHEGKCGRCGRTLTVPESIAAGLGPECATIMRKSA